jgi:hypothetical protein
MVGERVRKACVIENWTTSRQVFVSYAQGDEAFAAQLADDLSRSGAKVWLDIRNARPGRHWTRSIEQALSDSSMMIVILSRCALESPHVAVEWQAYLEAYRPVIPVLVEPCDLPGPLRTRRPLDFTRERDYPRVFHQLVTRLIDYGTRIRRSDPVIWTITENVIEYRESRAPVTSPPHTDDGDATTSFSSNGLRRMVDSLREILRAGW